MLILYSTFDFYMLYCKYPISSIEKLLQGLANERNKIHMHLVKENSNPNWSKNKESLQY